MNDGSKLSRLLAVERVGTGLDDYRVIATLERRIRGPLPRIPPRRTGDITGAQLGADDARALLPRLLAERQAAMTDDANRAAADRQVELAISFMRAVFLVITAAVLFASRV